VISDRGRLQIVTA